jgi:hypothetical protein
MPEEGVIKKEKVAVHQALTFKYAKTFVEFDSPLSP